MVKVTFTHGCAIPLRCRPTVFQLKGRNFFEVRLITDNSQRRNTIVFAIGPIIECENNKLE